MRLLAAWRIRHGDAEREIQLLQGDLSQLPPQHAVDILVVSAFPNDYLPTPSSLIGALYKAGISVEQLSRSKELDMRQEFSCWLSRPIIGALPFRQLLCIESGWRGTPPEITDDLFRALAPLFITTFPNGSVALPIIGAGDQGWPADQMLASILQTAVSWLRRGLAISVIKIVVYSERVADVARQTFLKIQADDAGHDTSDQTTRERGCNESSQKKNEYDVFLSYCRDDAATAEAIVQNLQRSVPTARVFYDSKAVLPGHSWLMDIAESLDDARRVVAIFTPHYWSSRYCKDEFAAALARQYDTGTPVLFPIYFRAAKIPYLFRNIQYIDCREGDSAKLAQACVALCSAIS
jgi:hypothetical protein